MNNGVILSLRLLVARHTPGEATLKRFPDLKTRIEEIRKHGEIEIPDFSWVAPCLEICIRVTVCPATFTQMQEVGLEVGIQQDSLFGTGQIRAHLWFSWKSNGQRMVGHYDLLAPCSGALFATFLPPDVPWLKLACTEKQNVYIFVYIYII